MQRRSNVDIQAAVNGAMQLQLAVVDLSISYWQTVLAQAIDFTELAARSAESLQSGDVDLSADYCRYAEFGMRNASEFGKFAFRASSLLQRTLDEMQPPGRRRG